MSKLLNFTRDGEALRLTGLLNADGKPVYTVELLYQFDGQELTFEDLLFFAKAISKDASEWGGLLCRFPEEAFTDVTIAEFERTWGGETNVQTQGCDGCWEDAQRGGPPD